MTLKQLSVFLENKPGALSTPCRLLSKAGINIQTFALADTQQYGILRLIVHEWEKAQQVLQQAGLVVKVTEVVALEVPDRPGGLVDILDQLDRARINLEYTYAFTDKKNGMGLLVFRFDNPEAAVKSLQGAGINVVGTSEVFKRLGN